MRGGKGKGWERREEGKGTGKEGRGGRTRGKGGTWNGGNGREGIGMPGNGEGRRRGEEGKDGERGRGKKSKNTPPSIPAYAPGWCHPRRQLMCHLFFRQKTDDVFFIHRPLQNDDLF